MQRSVIYQRKSRALSSSRTKFRTPADAAYSLAWYQPEKSTSESSCSVSAMLSFDCAATVPMTFYALIPFFISVYTERLACRIYLNILAEVGKVKQDSMTHALFQSNAADLTTFAMPGEAKNGMSKQPKI